MADPNDGGKKGDREFQVIVSALDDCRRLIAAGKVQRWDVVKWGVAVNVALATATATATAAALAHKPLGRPLFLLALAVAIASSLLVGHYNKRITGARRTATILTEWLKSSYDIDYNDILKTDVARDYSAASLKFVKWLIAHLSFFDFIIKFSPLELFGEYYDWQELIIFLSILVASALLVLLMYVFG